MHNLQNCVAFYKTIMQIKFFMSNKLKLLLEPKLINFKTLKH